MLRKILIILAWGLACLGVVIGTVLLVAYGNGYTYDFSTHRLVRNGLIILESDPDGVKVTVNGKDTKRKTPFRKTYEEGVHSFTLTRDGYRTWSKDVRMIASEVSLAQYVLMFENELKVETVDSYPGINLFVPSKDHRRIAYNVTAGADAGLWSVNTGNNDRVKLYTPRAATPERAAEVIQEVAWSDDGSHLLIKTLLGATANWLVVSDNGRDQVINVTQSSGFEFPALRFNHQNWRELYWLSPEGLRRINVVDNTVSGVLAANVIDYGFAEDRVIYVDGSKPQRSLWALERSGRKVELDSKLPLSDRYQIIASKFRGVPKVAVLPTATGSALLFEDAFGANFGPNIVLKGVNNIEFNPNGHFLAGFLGANITTYDVEKKQTWQFVPAASPLKFISWMDDFHFLYDRDGQTVVSEFDGLNTTTLLPSSPLPSWNSGDGKRIYTVVQLPSGTHQIKSIRIRQ